MHNFITATIMLQKKPTPGGFSLDLFTCIFDKVDLQMRVGIKAALPDLRRRKRLSIVFLKRTIAVGKVRKHNLSKFVKRTQTLITF